MSSGLNTHMKEPISATHLRNFPLTVVLVMVLSMTPGAGCNEDASEDPFSGSVTQAAWCKVANSPCCNNCAGAPSLVLSIPNASTRVGGDGTITLQISGDLDDNTDEVLSVFVEGLALGTIFNGNPADDQFNSATDSPSDCTLTTVSATLPEASLAGIAADGRIQITLTPNQTNNEIEDDGCDGASDETVTITVEYPVSSS